MSVVRSHTQAEVWQPPNGLGVPFLPCHSIGRTRSRDVRAKPGLLQPVRSEVFLKSHSRRSGISINFWPADRPCSSSATLSSLFGSERLPLDLEPDNADQSVSDRVSAAKIAYRNENSERRSQWNVEGSKFRRTGWTGVWC